MTGTGLWKWLEAASAVGDDRQVFGVNPFLQRIWNHSVCSGFHERSTIGLGVPHEEPDCRRPNQIVHRINRLRPVVPTKDDSTQPQCIGNAPNRPWERAFRFRGFRHGGQDGKERNRNACLHHKVRPCGRLPVPPHPDCRHIECDTCPLPSADPPSLSDPEHDHESHDARRATSEREERFHPVAAHCHIGPRLENASIGPDKPARSVWPRFRAPQPPDIHSIPGQLQQGSRNSKHLACHGR